MDNSVNWNILLTEGKESNSDFLISGELTENSLNRFGVVGFLKYFLNSVEVAEYNIKEGRKSCRLYIYLIIEFPE